MTRKEIENELKRILEEMNSWQSPKYPLPNNEVRRRELILWSQSILYDIKRAKKEKDKVKESFYSVIFGLVKSFLEYKEKSNE